MEKFSPEDILNLFSQGQSFLLSKRDIIKKLKVTPDLRKKVRNLLRHMVQNGLLFKSDKNRYGLKSEQKLISGKLEVNHKGFGFLIPHDSKISDIFIPKSKIGPAMPDDEVEVAITIKKSGRADEGEVVRVINRGRKFWIGYFERKGNAYYVINRDFNFPYEFRIENPKSFAKDLGKLVLIKVVTFEDSHGDKIGEIKEVLGLPGEEKTFYNSILAKYQISPFFSEDVLREVNDLEVDFDKIDSHRVDLTSLPFVTIDGEDAKDFDDAVLGIREGRNIRLFVSIADVSAFVKKDTFLDEEARARGTSTYFPGECIPMLPEKISNHLCSLVPYQNRKTLTCEILFDSHGRMLESKIYASVINSQARLTYEQVQEFLDGKRIHKVNPVSACHSIECLQELTLARMQKRKKRGAIDFDLPESKVIFTDENDIADIVQTKRFFSHMLIEECMISANISVARMMSAMNIPSLYRVHENPDEDKLKEFVLFLKEMKATKKQFFPKKPKDISLMIDSWRELPMKVTLHHMLLRCMKVARYTEENLGHFGLALRFYTHFTSPIRRYPDLIVHRQINDLLLVLKKQMTKDDVPILEYSFTQEKIINFKQLNSVIEKANLHPLSVVSAMGKQSSENERNSMEAEREMKKLYQAQFMLKFIGASFEAIVSGINKYGLYVTLKDHFVEGFLPVAELEDDYYFFEEHHHRFRGKRTRKIYEMGTKVQIKVFDISLEDKKIFFKLN